MAADRNSIVVSFMPEGRMQDPGRSRGRAGCRAGWGREESLDRGRDVPVVVGGIKAVIQQTGTEYL